jgi:hypothetical protein
LSVFGRKSSTDIGKSESNENDNETQIPKKLNQIAADFIIDFQEVGAGAP